MVCLPPPPHLIGSEIKSIISDVFTKANAENGFVIANTG